MTKLLSINQSHCHYMRISIQLVGVSLLELFFISLATCLICSLCRYCSLTSIGGIAFEVICVSCTSQLLFLTSNNCWVRLFGGGFVRAGEFTMQSVATVFSMSCSWTIIMWGLTLTMQNDLLLRRWSLLYKLGMNWCAFRAPADTSDSWSRNFYSTSL